MEKTGFKFHFHYFKEKFSSKFPTALHSSVLHFRLIEITTKLDIQKCTVKPNRNKPY